MKLTDAKWIFFDMGSTLVDEEEVHRERAGLIVQNIFELTGNEITIDKFLEEAYRQGTLGVPSPMYSATRALGGKLKTGYNNLLEVPYPESAEVLKKLHTKYKIGIIANQHGGSAKRLREYGLLDYVDLVYSSTEMGYSKPSSAFYASALSAVGCEPQEAVMVGDRIDNDIVPAKSVGMMTVRVRQGFYRDRHCRGEVDIPDADIATIAYLPTLFGL